MRISPTKYIQIMNFSQKNARQPAPSANHDLNINAYSLDELLDLFQLDYNMNITDLKQAKKRVLQLHPDKSRLPPEYFLFYKRAYEKIVELYEDLDRQNRPMTKEATVYNSEVYGSNGRDSVFEFDKNIKRQIDADARESARKFNQKFNDLFEKNMRQAPDPQKNKWFTSEEGDTDAPYKAPESGVSANNIGRIIEDMKGAAAAAGKSTALIQRARGAREHYHATIGAASLYDDDATDEDATYISTNNLFGGLKFDDIKKVHRDETIIPVGTASEIATETAARAITMDDFIAQREKSAAPPMAKYEAERILAEKEKRDRARIMEQHHRANLRADEYGAKSREVLSHMLRLKQ